MINRRLLHVATGPSPASPQVTTRMAAAVLGGRSLRALRAEASDGLAVAYMRFGEYELAAECLIDTMQSGLSRSGLDPGIILPMLTEVNRRSDKKIVGKFYASIREDLLAGPGTHPVKAVAHIIDNNFSITVHDYVFLKESSKPLLAGDDESAALAHRALAEAAIREDRYTEARSHTAEAVRRCVTLDRYPWMNTALLGLHARVLLKTGEPEEAFNHALRGWSATLPTLLNCKDDFARDRLRWMATDCIDVAITVACERSDWNLLTDFIENSRLQVARAAVPDRDEQVVSEFPEGLVRNTLRAIAQGASRAALHALGADWKVGKRVHMATTWMGRSEVVAAVRKHDLTPGGRITAIDAHDLLEPDLANDTVAWFAAVRNDVLFWSLADHTGAVDGGSVDLRQQDLAASLTALRKRLQRGRQPNDPRDIGPETDNDIDIVEALAAAENPYEEEVLKPLSALLPPRLRELALQHTEQSPLRVLFTLPAELSTVPWPIVPLRDELRLIERVELQVLTPSAVRSSSARPSRRTTLQPVVVSCSNPDGKLKDAPPVQGTVLLDGNTSGNVTLSQFKAAIRAAHWESGGLLFVRSHLGTSTNAPYIADRGILFSDGVLSARDLAVTGQDGQPELTLPNRTVLALCSGAAAGDASGLALGLAAACRLAGAEEVLTSVFDIPDTMWGCEFDGRLAEALRDPSPSTASLRRLQFECLHQWRQVQIDDETRWDDLPHPLIWASFVVIH